VSSFFGDEQKLKDSKDKANDFNNFFITTEKLNVQKGDATSILKYSFPGKFPSTKIIPITEAEIKTLIYSLKPR
jgi:hypothetical protein